MPARKAAAKPKAEAEEVKPAAAKKQATAKKKPATKKATVAKKVPIVKKVAKPKPEPEPEPEAMTEIFIPPALVEVFVAGKSPLVLDNKMVYPGERHVVKWLHFADVVKARPGMLKWRAGPGHEWSEEIE
jgi:hypothetical protein